jgi:hypothetical protein
LITFGSVPVTDISLTDTCKALPHVNLVLSLVNEYDVVSRADKPYLQSLVDLYRARYGLPPLHMPALSSLAGAVGGQGVWPVPPPQFHLLGDIVVLKMDGESAADDESDATAVVQRSLRTVQLSEDELVKLLFCSVAVHRRAVYLERMDTLVGAAEMQAPMEKEKDNLVMESEVLDDVESD